MLIKSFFIKKTMKQKIAYIFFILLLYLFLFDPPFYMFRGALRFSNLILASSFIYIIHYWKSIKQIVSFQKRELHLFSILFIFIIIRCALQLEMSFVNKTLMAFLNIFMVLPFLIHFAKKNGFGSEDQIVRAIMITCTIATIITMICIGNSIVQEVVKFQILQMDEEEYLFKNEYRGFGLASKLTSNYGFILGFIAGVGCFYLKRNKWFLFCIPFMIIAGVVNSRTSVIIASEIIIIYLFFSKQKLYAVIIGIVAFMFLNYFESFLELIGVNDRTFDWIMSFQDQVSSVAKTGNIHSSYTANIIFGSHVIWPENIDEWMLGRGYDIFYASGFHSDNGWIRQLNFGGLFYILLFYYIMIFLMRRLVNSHQRVYMLIFLLVFSVVNSKTMSYPGDTLFPLMMLFYFFKIKPAPIKIIKHENINSNYSSPLL